MRIIEAKQKELHSDKCDSGSEDTSEQKQSHEWGNCGRNPTDKNNIAHQPKNSATDRAAEAR